MKTLEQIIDLACEKLPEGWEIVIETERGAGSVIAVRPDGTRVDMGDGEMDIREQYLSALRLAIDETIAATETFIATRTPTPPSRGPMAGGETKAAPERA